MVINYIILMELNAANKTPGRWPFRVYKRIKLFVSLHQPEGATKFANTDSFPLSV